MSLWVLWRPDQALHVCAVDGDEVSEAHCGTLLVSLGAKMINRIYKRLSRKATFTEHDIVGTLQRAIDKGQFAPPMFTDEHLAFGKGRLSAFRSESEWLLAFEYLIYIGEADLYSNRLYCYGNRVKQHVYDHTLFELVPEGQEEPNPLDFTVRIDSMMRHFRFTTDDCRKASIDLEAPISGDVDFDKHLQVLRLLVSSLPDAELFLPTEELLGVMQASESLRLFLQVSAWHHPDPRLQPHNSLTDCLRTLASALARDTPDMYQCLPETFNTDWAHWPPFGLRDVSQSS